MKLYNLQARFTDHLLDKSKDISSLDISGPFAAEELMQLYRNNFYISICEYLRACFPSVEALVGQDFFEQLAKAFAVAEPLQSASIESYGALFSGFIKNFQHTQSIAYLSDVAAIDWAVDQAKTVYEFAPFPFAQLESVNAQEQMQLQFQVQKKCCLIISEHPAYSIWQGVKTGHLEDINLTQAQSVLVCPSATQSVEMFNLTKEQVAIFAAIQQRQQFQQLLELDGFQQQLGFFIENGIINNFILEGKL